MFNRDLGHPELIKLIGEERARRQKVKLSEEGVQSIGGAAGGERGHNLKQQDCSKYLL